MKVHVSLIIVNYNYGQYIARAIRSCLNQSIANLVEIIVVDDCSTDSSRKIINTFGDSVKKIFLQENKGVSYASNQGVKSAEGMYVMRVDADDYIHDKMVEILMIFLEMNPHFSFAYCDHFRVNKFEEKRERIKLNNDKNLFNHGAGILFKKSHLEAIGLFDESMQNCEVMLLLKKLQSKGYEGIYVELPLYRYLRHENNMTNNLIERKKWEKRVTERL